MTKFKTYYMDNALFSLQEVIDTAQERLADVEFDTMVGTGFSGSVVVPALALAMGKKFVLVRKETDDSHHGSGRMLGELGAAWIFVDDFISSGRTRRRVIDKVTEGIEGNRIYGALPNVRMVGQYLYQAYKDDSYAEKGKFEDYQPGWAELVGW